MRIKTKTVLVAYILATSTIIPCLVYPEDVGIIIIANKNVDANSMTEAEIKNIFLGTTPQWPDMSKINIYTLNNNLQIHKIFVKKYTKRNSKQFKLYWRNQLFTGKGNIPKVFKTEEEMVSAVAKTTGAIGYVSSTASVDKVKVITVLDN